MREPFVMTFGRFKGRLLSDIPDSYLNWLAGRGLRDPLRTALLAELQSRLQQEYEPATPAIMVRNVDPAIAVLVIEHGRKSLARRLHPDREGGDVEAMAAVNATADLLIDAMRRAG